MPASSTPTAHAFGSGITTSCLCSDNGKNAHASAEESEAFGSASTGVDPGFRHKPCCQPKRREGPTGQQDRSTEPALTRIRFGLVVPPLRARARALEPGCI